jgi:hypothetical protein
MGERMHVIGPGDEPIYICKKKDVHKLFNAEFSMYFEAWQYYNAGMGFPDKRHWSELDPVYTRIIISMENHYKRHFSTDRVIIRYLEVTIKYLENIAKLLAKKG